MGLIIYFFKGRFLILAVALMDNFLEGIAPLKTHHTFTQI